MAMSTKGVVDVVFCIDASGSMAPCIDAVRKNLDAFLDALGGDANRKIDCRLAGILLNDRSGLIWSSRSFRPRRHRGPLAVVISGLPLAAGPPRQEFLSGNSRTPALICQSM